jgi:nucleoside-diphosphate-sugar epimerase
MIFVDTADASDHKGAAEAIAKGIAKGHSKEKPGFYIHTSGTGILCWQDMRTETYGEPPYTQAYDDLDRVSDLTNLPEDAFHRDVDKVVLEASSDSVKTAIVCPPTIYGPGRGPGNQRSRQVYELVASTLKKGQAPQLGRGLTEWDNVHVHDLSDLYVLLTEAAVANKPELDSKLWGKDGYFLTENGTHVWGQISKLVGETAFNKGYIKNKEVKAMEIKEATDFAGFQALSWGVNSKGFGKRARKYLGYSPKGKSLEEEIPDIIESEAKALGIKKGHAEIASGGTA